MRTERPRIAYRPDSGVPPEAERSALRDIYRRAIERHHEECHAKKKAAGGAHPDGRDSAKEIDNGCAATTKFTA